MKIPSMLLDKPPFFPNFAMEIFLTERIGRVWLTHGKTSFRSLGSNKIKIKEGFITFLRGSSIELSEIYKVEAIISDLKLN